MRLLVPLRFSFLAVLVAVIALFGHPEGVARASGNSITSPDTDGDVGQYTSLKLDANGNPVVSYKDATNGALKLMHCNDPNCAGGDESITSHDIGSIVNGTSLALDVSGNPVVAYVGPSGYLRVMHCNDPNCAGGDESITTADWNMVGYLSSLALDKAGNPVIAYYAEGAPSYLLHCNDPNCAGGDESITPFETGAIHNSLVLDASGNPVVSYRPIEGGYPLKVMHCNDSNCAGGDESISRVDDNFGGWTSLHLDTTGNPVVSYGGGLKLLHCGNSDCTSVNSITSPGEGGIYDWTVSLTLDSGGRPVVAYQAYAGSDSNAYLRVLHCNDANCAGGDESITNPDSVTFANVFPSLALDAGGRPVVSYYDTTHGDLKLLHCVDLNCTGAAPVGGISDMPDVRGAHLEGSASDRSRIPVPAEVAAAFAAGVVALGVGGWYARRRGHRRAS